MKVFACLEIDEALAHAAAGGQSLHLHRVIPDRAKAPRCFVQAVDRGEDIAHLFDLDRARLVRTARELGVKVVYVDRDGTDRQHVDLVGKPLRKAKALAESGDHPAEPCQGCGQPATTHYPPDVRPDEATPSCGRPACELRMQAVLDYHEEAGDR